MAGPVVLITGASQGIGAEIARVFAREVRGVRLALVARNRTKLAAVARTCAGAGARVEIFPCDVSGEAGVAAMARAVRKRLGAVDVLINNAGKFFAAPFVRMSAADFDRMLAANLRSVSRFQGLCAGDGAAPPGRCFQHELDRRPDRVSRRGGATPPRSLA